MLTFTRSSTGAHPAGDALMLVFLVSFAFFTILLRTMNRDGRYHPLFITGVYGTLGTALLVAIGALFGRLSAVRQPLDGSPDNVIWFFAVIVLGLSLGAQIAQVYALRSLAAGTFSVVVSYGSLLVGIAGAILIVGERLTPLGIVAGLLLAVALGLAVAPLPRLSFNTREFLRGRR
ncbi:MAG: EamA family transporter [Candidatus Velthaea sp.]